MKAAAALLALCAGTPAALAVQVPSDCRAAAEQVVTRFDADWASADFGRVMMDPFSQSFGCEFYGDIDARQLCEAFADMKKEMRGSRCVTRILRTQQIGSRVQVIACRRFEAADSRPLAGDAQPTAPAPIEEQCHVFYLQPERDALKIVGIEEYDPRGLADLGGPAEHRYANRDLALEFDVPEGMFCVPRPRMCALDHVVLRGDELRTQLHVLLMLTDGPLDLQAAFDHDMQRFQREHPGAEVKGRRSVSLLRFPALEAEASYMACGCTFTAGRESKRARRSLRRYAQVDKNVLLAVELDHESTDKRSAEACYQSLLRSLQIGVAPGASYYDLLAHRFGWGPIDGGRFAHEPTGFALAAPSGFSLEKTRAISLFHLVARRGRTPIQVEGIELLEPECDVESLGAGDDANFLAGSDPGAGFTAEHRPRTVASRDALLVERRLKSDSRRAQDTLYVMIPGVVFTISASGSESDVAAARKDLDAIAEAITLRP